jgi:CTP:molybdopterin cytidylyltransferase MocA
MGSPKPLVQRGDGTFLAQGVRHLWTACDQVVIVLGSRASQVQAAAEAEFERLVTDGQLHADLQRAHRHGAKGLEVRFIVNPKWKSGMFSSVKAGLSEALRLKPSSILVLPVDHPEVKPATISDLAGAMDAALSAYKSGKGKAGFAYALVPRHRGQNGHPIALSPALAREVVRDAEAENLSEAVHRNSRLLGFLDTNDRGVVRNFNRPGD